MKNKFLLLGATALLSTGLAMGVMAEDEYDGPDTGTAVLKATASFTSPIRADAGPIEFGTLDPVIGGDVTVSATSARSATGAAIISDGRSNRGYIDLWGGRVSYDIDGGNVIDGDYVIFDGLQGKTITLIEKGSVTQENPNGTTCGTVTDFEIGPYEYGTTSYEESTVSVLEIPVGATLSIQEGYTPSGNITACEGSTTVTYLLRY